MLDIDAIRARLAAATPGPWSFEQDGRKGAYLYDARGMLWQIAAPIEMDHDVRDWAADEPNPDVEDWRDNFSWASASKGTGTLVEHAPTDLAALCDEVERLRAQVAELLPFARYGTSHMLERGDYELARKFRDRIEAGEFGEVAA